MISIKLNFLQLLVFTISLCMQHPGPNNSILNCVRYKIWFYKELSQIYLGIPTGHSIQLALVCVGLGKFIYTISLFTGNILKYVGATYLIYLAWKMFGSLNIKNSVEDKSVTSKIL